jgi:hypothetical protein
MLFPFSLVLNGAIDLLESTGKLLAQHNNSLNRTTQWHESQESFQFELCDFATAG